MPSIKFLKKEMEVQEDIVSWSKPQSPWGIELQYILGELPQISFVKQK